MPVAPPRACARCNQPAQRGKPCACRPAFEGSQHPSSNDRRWQQARTNQLRTQPICHCGHLATDVDHIIPLAEQGDRYSPSNLQSLCHTHHVEKTAADAQRGKTRAR